MSVPRIVLPYAPFDPNPPLILPAAGLSQLASLLGADAPVAVVHTTVRLRAADDEAPQEPPPDEPPPPPPPPGESPAPPPDGGGGGPIIPSVDDIAAAVRRSLQTTLDTLQNGITSVISKAVGFIGDQITAIGGAISLIARAVSDSIGNALATLIPSALSVLSGNTAVLAAFVEAFLSTATTPEALTSTITDKVGQLWPNIANHTAELATISATGGVSAIAELFQALLPPDLYGNTAKLLFGVNQAGTYADHVTGLLTQSGVTGWLLHMLMIVGAAPSIASASWASSIEKYTRASMSSERVVTLSPEVASVALRRNMIDYDYFANAAKQAGYDDTALNTVASLTEQRLDPLQLITLYRRGDIDSDLFYALMDHNGYSDGIARLSLMAAENRGTPSDLILFLVREVFDNNKRQALNLDAEYPSAATSEFAKLGVSEDLARNYWAAHWQLPSPSQGYEMLWRDLIDNDQLSALIGALDYAPIWRQRLIDIAYNPLGRIDIRRIHKSLGLSREWLLKQYQYIGYSPTNQVILADYTEAINKVEDKTAIEPFVASIRGRIINRYVDGLATERQLRDTLTSLQYTNEQIDAYISVAAFDREDNRLDAVRRGVKSSYLALRMTRDEAANELDNAGFTAEQRNNILADMDVDHRYRERTSDEKAQRDLSKSELLTAYTDSLITADELHNYLKHLGYDDNEAALLVSIETVKRDRVTNNILKSAIQSQYIANQLSDVDASAQLDAIGIPPRQRTALLQTWRTHRTVSHKYLATTELSAMVSRGIINDADAAAELAGNGYNDVQIGRLLQLWGSKDSEKRKRLEEGRQARKEAADKATRRAAAVEERRREAAIRRASRTDVIRELHTGLLSSDVAILRLAQLGFTQEAATEIIATELAIMNKRAAALVERKRLSEQRAQDRRDAALRRQQERQAASASPRQRDLTTANILASYTRRVIQRGEATAQLLTLGYDANETEQLIKTEEAKHAATTGT